MKKILLLFSAMAISFLSLSQESQDVIYLKNGTVIKGEIVKKDADNNYIIKSFDGQLYLFNDSEIEQLWKEENLNLKEYGGTFSYGMSLGGGGIVGVPFRFHNGEKFAFEMGIHYRPTIIYATNYWGGTSTQFEHATLFSVGANYFIGKYFKENKQKVKLNGIKIMAGAGTGGYDTFLFAIGWTHESFKKYRYNKSFTFELGPGFAFTDYSSSNDYTADSFSGGSLALYWKVQWNWFEK
jgi:hypothetical protein